ncbi:MAG: hypothetical protein J1E80_04890 [Desulfovibrionaceae bacterium]|nr:hypothetical protein [Desulfovibrionaceae bacterium]
MVRFWKITPGGNPTVLLEADAVAPALRASAAAEIMSPGHLAAEQVGFLTSSGGLTPRLDMMGGEFCLNATRACAALLARQGVLPSLGPDRWGGQIEVSGAESAVDVRVRRVPADQGQMDWTAAAGMKFRGMPEPPAMLGGACLIRVPGIAHILLENAPPPSADNLPSACAELRARFGLDGEAAVGCLWLDTMTDPPAVYPVVWVRATKTLCAESACGSGTLACALALRARSGDSRLAIRQPSGDILTVSFESDSAKSARGGQIQHIWVGGPVRFVAEGTLFLRRL